LIGSEKAGSEAHSSLGPLPSLSKDAESSIK